MIVSSVDSKHQEILDDIDRLNIGYQIRLLPVERQNWQPYFHELSIDSHLNNKLFLAHDRLFAGRHKSLLLSGLALAKDDPIETIELVGDKVCLEAKINSASPRLVEKFPNSKYSDNARWKCAIELDPDSQQQNFELIITLNSGQKITYQKIELQQTKLSQRYEALNRRLNRDLAQRIESIHNSRQLMSERISQGKNYLFAIGNARSGTTALGRLLNYSSDICLGIERYSQNEDVSAVSFTKTSFFDCQSKNYLVRPHFYEDIKDKFARARYIGDKRPGFVQSWRNTWLNIPQAKIVYIFRNVYDVACSYNSRADDAANGSDRFWSSQRDFAQAVRDWNRGLIEIRNMMDFYEVYLIKYEDFFVNPDKMIHLFNYLGVDSAEEQVSQGIDKVYQDALTLQGKPRVLSDAELEYVNANADFKAYNDLLSLYESQFARP